LTAEPTGEFLGPSLGPVRHHELTHALGGQALQRQLAHLAGTEDQRAPAPQRTKDLLGQFDRRTRDRCRADPEGSLAPGTPADSERSLEEPRQDRTYRRRDRIDRRR